MVVIIKLVGEAGDQQASLMFIWLFNPSEGHGPQIHQLNDRLRCIVGRKVPETFFYFFIIYCFDKGP